MKKNYKRPSGDLQSWTKNVLQFGAAPPINTEQKASQKKMRNYQNEFILQKKFPDYDYKPFL